MPNAAYKKSQAARAERALQQLRNELEREGERKQVKAISQFLIEADEDSFYRLAEILSPRPRPLNELLEEDRAAAANG